MTNLSLDEKIALEEIFIVLDDRKIRKLESIRRHIMFYKCMRMFSRRRLLPIRG
jgi:hypothetical protein